MPEPGNSPAGRCHAFRAFVGDPFLLAPLFVLLLTSYTIAFIPGLTFSLADILGLTLDFTAFSWPLVIFFWLVRLYLVFLLVGLILSRSLLFPALTSSALLFLSYYPVAWGWLGWIALVPFLCLSRSDAPSWRIYLAAWYSGLAFFGPVLEWMRLADFRMYFTWYMLAVYCSLYFPAALYLLRLLERRLSLPLVLALPLAWTALEFLRSFLLTGFAWYFLGHTQQAFLPLIQISDITGAYGVTFLVAAVNAWLFELLYANRWFRYFLKLAEKTRSISQAAGQPTPLGSGPVQAIFTPDKWFAAQGFWAFSLVVGALFYGFWRLEQENFTPGPRLALLQGNLDQRLRNEAAGINNVPARKEINQHYLNLCQVALDQRPIADLLVWPETSFPAEWFEVSAKVPSPDVPLDWAAEGEKIQKIVRLLAGTLKTNLLLGMNANVLEEPKKHVRYNSALLVTAEGNWGPRYDKMHRIPFGEFVPELPFMEQFAPYDFPYSITSGDHFRRFKMGKHHFGVVICYEDTDPILSRHYGRSGPDGPPVDFLLNISNDGWFDGSSEHDEHLAICRFRAIECRRAVARAVNMGLSAVIDGNGRILDPGLVTQFGEFQSWQIPDTAGRTPELPGSRWIEFKKTAGVLGATIPIDGRTSWYARLGDWLPAICWLVIVAGFFRHMLRKWQRRTA